MDEFVTKEEIDDDVIFQMPNEVRLLRKIE